MLGYISKLFMFFNNVIYLESLPDLPDPSEIAFVTIDLPYGANQLLAEAIHDYGRVLRQPPVIITGVFERPGALLIVWNEV